MIKSLRAQLKALYKPPSKQTCIMVPTTAMAAASIIVLRLPSQSASAPAKRDAKIQPRVSTLGRGREESE